MLVVFSRIELIPRELYDSFMVILKEMEKREPWNSMNNYHICDVI